ncbi:MAG: type II CRISPR RNA-guided endonuclease Cas9 [Flavisolibacter sp.]
MRIIYGLDLGVASIGWSVINISDEGRYSIKGIGSRIIPYSDKEGDEFGKGTGESVNQQRTTARSSRKGLDRYQLRRKLLNRLLTEKGMQPDSSDMNLSAIELYSLRSKAASERVSLKELGRIWLHLNQRRGYKHGSEESGDKKERDWVASINNRYSAIKGKQTIGQFFYQELKAHLEQGKYYRIKEQIFPRDAYIEEFNTIWKTQSQFYLEILTEELKEQIRDEIIYYQRPLKSQKGLVSVCEFEGFFTHHNNGRNTQEIFVGPKVAPKSSPLFQAAKLWESINAITVKQITHDGSKHPTFDLSPFKENIFYYLNHNITLTEAGLFQILGIKKTDGYYADQIVRKKGIQGNLTLTAIEKALEGYERKEDLTRFQLNLETGSNTDKSTGELLSIEQISSDCEKEPLYQVWHTCYSIKDKEERIKALQKRFGLPHNYAEALGNIDFAMGNFGNKSAKAIRKILPSLMKGLNYSDAMSAVGYDHSFSETKEEREQKVLLDKLPLLQKNALRQPVVEKILNQMINIMNSLIEQYGSPDEIRVELARELKQSKEERNDFFNSINQRTKQNEKIAERLQKEYGVKPTRKNIEKWRLWHEVNGRCLYCNQQITVEQFLKGIESDVEHIIPKAFFFDDSFANKTIAHIRCNSTKSNVTAYDYMNSRGSDAVDTYMKTIYDLFHNDKADRHRIVDEGVHCLTGKIGWSKYQRLQWRKEDIPKDFINRQLQETRYIARKAKQILNKVCREVYSTNGTITEKLRKLWGWEDVLMNINLPRYQQQGLTDTKEIGSNGHTQYKEYIPGWSKRDDHRHHAIDALTVACTKQGFIQRMNTLAASETKDAMYAEVKDKEFSERLTLLEKYLVDQRPFTTAQVQDVLEAILVSYKAGKKVATLGKRKIRKDGKKTVVQEGIIVPRGALSEQSVYGKIKTPSRDFKKGKLKHFPVKYLFENPHLIFKEKVRTLVEERLAQHNSDAKKAVASLKKEPVFLDAEKKVPLSFGTCLEEVTVFKYELGAGQGKLFDGKEDEKKALSILNYVVDNKIREKIENRLYDSNQKYIGTKEAFKNLKENPVWFNEEKQIPILSVRTFTVLTAIEPVKKDESGRNIGFVLTKNNHHIALYENEEGELIEATSTFWHSVERKAMFYHHFTREERDTIQENTIIKNPKVVWDRILSLPEETFTQSFLRKLPPSNWKFVVSLQRNEMFVIGLNKETLAEIIEKEDYKQIGQCLYRVQKIAESDYFFRLHTETKVDDKYDGKTDMNLSSQLGKMIRISSLKAWKQKSPIKVRVNNLGQIVKIG